MLNSTFMQLSTLGVEKVKIYDSVWYVANWCCLCYYANRFQMGLKSGTKIIFTTLLFLNMLPVLHYKINCWRYDASKMGHDFLDTL